MTGTSTLRLIAVAAGLALAGGCIIYDTDRVVVDDDDDVWVPVNSEPYVFDGYAGCYYDAYNMDDIFELYAYADDPDGVYDVVQVWADVYDDFTGQLIQSFELYPTDNPQEWWSDWLVSTTYVDCWYGAYSVDLVAYDSYDAYGVLTIYPNTYR